MKRMTHPLHGAHHAANTNEEAAMRANGWTAEDDTPEPAVPPVDDAPEPVATRRGRPPAKA